MNNVKIEKIVGYELLDSRSNPTVGAKVILSDGSIGFAISPSGASTGSFEAHEKRDGNINRYNGKGVIEAVNGINGEISPSIMGEDIFNQRKIDKKLIELDGTENKSRLGANAILAVSLACANAASKSLRIPLYKYLGGINATDMPRPMMNILNGGAHASNNVEIQEFMIVPSISNGFCEAVRQGSEIYHSLAKTLTEKGLSISVGDEGGFAPNLSSDEEAIELIIKAIERAGYNTDNTKIALDIASSEWYENSEYKMPKTKRNFKGEQLIEYYEKLVSKYPIISIEDGLAEEDWGLWQVLTEKLGSKIQLVGDDLFVTNMARLKKGIQNKTANSILIKPNQIGTLTETLDVINLAKKNGYSTVISHRSGETEDSFISDLAVAVNSGQIKTGAPCRTDRVTKYNRLMMIEKEL